MSCSRLVLIASLVLCLASCGGSPQNSQQQSPPPVAPTTGMSQTITFGAAPSDPVVTTGGVRVGDTYTILATADSGLPVTLTSTTPSVCNLTTALAVGTCTIQAVQAGDSTYGPAATVTQSFNISAASALTTISVTPANASLSSGGSQTFKANGFDQYNQPITATFTWAASDNVKMSSGSYTAPATRNGETVSVTASSSGVTSAPAVVTVAPATPVLSGVSLSQGDVTISAPSGSTVYAVNEIDQFNRPLLPTVPCTFKSSSTAAASIDANSGVVTAQNSTPNTLLTNITASCNRMQTASAVVTVLAQQSYAASLVVQDAQVQQSTNTSVSVAAYDEYNQPFPVGLIDVDSGYDPTIISAVAQQSAEGNQIIITGLKVGTTQVKVHIDTDDSVSTTFTVTVIPCLPNICYTPVLTSIIVTGETQSMDYQGTQTFTAQAYDQRGGSLAETFTWSSSDTTVLTVDQNGNVTASGVGSATINATTGGVVGTSFTLTVNSISPQPISVTSTFPTVAALRATRAEQITITGSGFTNGAIVTFGSDATPANTVFKSSTQLVVNVPATDLQVTQDTTVQIVVTNPQQSGYSGPAVSNSLPFLITTQGMVSITFDDSYQTTFDRGIPIFNNARFPITLYVITGQYNTGLRSDGYPWGWNNDNCPTVAPPPTTFDPTCFVGVGASSEYMTWDEVHTVANAGNEIGAHTRSHNSLSTLSSSDQNGEINGAKQDLVANGFTITSMAYPYGDYGCLTENETSTTCVEGSGSTAQQIGTIVKSAGYTGSRTSDFGFEGDYSGTSATNEPLYLMSQAGDVTPGDAMTTAQLTALVDAAKANGSWLIFLFHRVDDPCRSDQCVPPQTPNAISIDSTALQGLSDYLTSKKVRVVTVTDGLAIEGLNGQKGKVVFPTE